MSNERFSSDGGTNPKHEYELMLEIERLESLREDMDETGFSSLNEIEVALQLTKGGSETAELAARRELLEEVQDELIDLGLNTYAEINDQIKLLHTELDKLEGFDPNA